MCNCRTHVYIYIYICRFYSILDTPPAHLRESHCIAIRKKSLSLQTTGRFVRRNGNNSTNKLSWSVIRYSIGICLRDLQEGWQPIQQYGRLKVEMAILRRVSLRYGSSDDQSTAFGHISSFSRPCFGFIRHTTTHV